MGIIQAPDLKRKRPIPANMKMVLLLAFVFGIVLHQCYKKYEAKNIQFVNIQFENSTSVSTDVVFTAISNTLQEKERKIIIKVYSKQGEVIASRITTVLIKAKAKTEYRKVLQEFTRPLQPNEKLDHATVEIFNSSIF